MPKSAAHASTTASFRRACLLIFLVLIYLTGGPILMVANKEIMETAHFPYPISVASLGTLGSTIFTQGAVFFRFAKVQTESGQFVSVNGVASTILPTAACKTLTLAAGNAVYLHLGFGLIQMLKAMQPAFILLVMFLLGLPPVSKLARFFTAVIMAGTVLEVQGDVKATFFGVVLMCVSEVAEAFNVALTQKLLQTPKFSVFDGMYFLSPPTLLCMTIVASILEWPSILQTGGLYSVIEHPMLFLSSATLGVIGTYVGFFLMQMTSALSVKILNTIRSIGLVVLGTMFYAESVAPLEITGYIIALIGFIGYTYTQLPQKAAKGKTKYSAEDGETIGAPDSVGEETIGAPDSVGEELPDNSLDRDEQIVRILPRSERT